MSATRRWAIVAVLSASLLVITVDMTILNIAIPEMAADLQPTSDQLLWIVDVYSLVLAGLLVSMSAIGDRWGRKRMLLLGYAIFGAVSTLVLFTSTADAVIAVRALLGLGGAMIMPTTLSLIRTTFTDAAERALALGIWAAVSGIGLAIGPVLGGLLLEHFSWHAAFLINVPLMVVALIAGALILVESRASDPGRWDWIGAAQSLVGMFALVWAIKRFARQESLLAWDAWLALLGAVAILVWFVLRSRQRPDPLLDLSLFQNRPFTAGIVAALGATFAMSAALLLLAQWLQAVEGLSPVETGLHLLPAAVGGAAAAILAPLVARLIGARAVLGGALVLAGVGMVLLYAAGDALTVGHILVAMALVGIGSGALAIGSALIMSGTPEERAGNAAALEETSYELGSVLGVAILGSIAAVVFRAPLANSVAFQALDERTADAVRESIGSAVAIAEHLGSPQLLAAVRDAFTEASQVTSLIGGIVMAIVGVVVFLVTPRGTDIAAEHH